MWLSGQWLWDREKSKPVKFVGIQLPDDADGWSYFIIEHLTHPGVHHHLRFMGAAFWRDRFIELYDDKGKLLI